MLCWCCGDAMWQNLWHFKKIIEHLRNKKKPKILDFLEFLRSFEIVVKLSL